MKRFIYKAKDRAGQLVTGEVEASTVSVAVKLVRQRGLVVISIKPASESLVTLIGKFRERITLSDVSTFTRQLATMVNAGLPITEALLILRSQSKGAMQKVVAQILTDIEGGESLSSAVSKHPKVFNPTYIALVKSGEVGGVMDEVLARLADNLERQQEFKGKVKGALIYPAIIVVGMFVVALIMMIFVIPRLTSLYGDFNAKLPIATKILIGISTFFIKAWPLILIVVFGGFYAYQAFRKTPAGRKRTDELMFKIPIIGDLQRQVILTELTRTLSLMVGSGVSILEGLNITAGVVGNTVISDALKDEKAFPPMIYHLISVGEKSGKLDEILLSMAEFFDREVETTTNNLATLVEPILIIIVGAGVGLVVASVIMPIYSLVNAI